MRRKPTSVIYLTALYLHHVRGQHEFTARDLFDVRRDAQRWYDDQIPNLHQELTAIRQRHGFTNDEWDQVMTQSGSFYFAPDDRINACNQEIAAFMKRHVHIRRYWEGDHANAAAVSRACKYGQFVLIATKPLRTYRLHESIIDHPSF